MPQAPIEYEEFPTETFAKIVGGHNWVVARRSPRVVARYANRYGEAEVICLSPQKYENATRLAYLLLTEGYD